ncbi:MAG: hypothetical protein K2N21_00970 [Rikenellaceae bacterium]|nr:hypothetical protein [Rikenellaceae bacterium]
MKKLLLLLVAFLCVVSCQKDDSQDDLPIKGFYAPEFYGPVAPDDEISLVGEGFTQGSEIWFRKSEVSVNESNYVQATVTKISAAGMTFTVPQTNGDQCVMLKHNGVMYELFCLTVKGSGDVSEILPRKIVKIALANYSYSYKYDDKGRLGEVTESRGNVTAGVKYAYSTDRITVSAEEGVKGTYELRDGRTDYYTDIDNEFDCKFEYDSDRLSKITGEDIMGDDSRSFEAEYTFDDDNIVGYTYKDGEQTTTLIFAYDRRQPNNLNIDLLSLLCKDLMINSESMQLGVSGNRSMYLPNRIDVIPANERAYALKFTYQMNDNYIGQITAIDDAMKKHATWVLFYEQ